MSIKEWCAETGESTPTAVAQKIRRASPGIKVSVNSEFDEELKSLYYKSGRSARRNENPNGGGLQKPERSDKRKRNRSVRSKNRNGGNVPSFGDDPSFWILIVLLAFFDGISFAIIGKQVFPDYNRADVVFCVGGVASVIALVKNNLSIKNNARYGWWATCFAVTQMGVFICAFTQSWVIGKVLIAIVVVASLSATIDGKRQRLMKP